MQQITKNKYIYLFVIVRIIDKFRTVRMLKVQVTNERNPKIKFPWHKVVRIVNFFELFHSIGVSAHVEFIAFNR